MRDTFLDNADDMQWLRGVHWKELPSDARCALLHGNEDAPDKIEAWCCDNPNYDQPADYVMVPMHITLHSTVAQ